LQDILLFFCPKKKFLRKKWQTKNKKMVDEEWRISLTKYIKETTKVTLAWNQKFNLEQKIYNQVHKIRNPVILIKYLKEIQILNLKVNINEINELLYKLIVIKPKKENSYSLYPSTIYNNKRFTCAFASKIIMEELNKYLYQDLSNIVISYLFF